MPQNLGVKILADKVVPVGGTFEFNTDQPYTPTVSIYTRFDIPSEWTDIEGEEVKEELSQELKQLAHYLWNALDDCFNHGYTGNTSQNPLDVKLRIIELTGMLAGLSRSITRGD